MTRLLTGSLVFLLFAGPLQAAEVAEPLFSRHVVPLFSKLGCNSGACHGTVKGQNGFRLTLFGADPVLDLERLLREDAGRRLNLNDPGASLILLKGTGQVSHQGGKRMDVASPEYRIIRDWLTGGARLDPMDKSAATRITVTPASPTVKPGDAYSLKVQAAFADGSEEDVTALCTFESRDKQVAEVDAAGQVKATGVGDTALVVRYRSQPALAQVLVPGEPKGTFPAAKEHNFIDKHVLDKLRRLNIHPAELCDDVTFLRRVTLDVAGILPTPEEIRAFQGDSSADKRAKKIDELLARPGHASLWATRFCDILRPGGYVPAVGLAEHPNNRRFYEWVRARLLENLPFDEFAERILLATSREGRSEDEWIEEVRALAGEDTAKEGDLKAYAGRRTLDLYWQRANASGVKGALQIAHGFLGLRLECAQCHRHPHDVWQQDDLLGFANFFMKVSTPAANASSAEVQKKTEGLVQEVKELKEEAKKATEKAKDKSLPKEELTKLQMEAKALNEKVKGIEDLSKRLKGSEIHPGAKGGFASVVSPLGKQESKQFRLLGAGKAVEVPADKDPRELAVAWMRQPDNPFFARAIVNRIWATYLGRGIIDPPDQLSPLNPPSHPELLAELSKGFIENKYDLKWLHRIILNSRTYQQSAQTNATSRADTTNYASFYLRRLPAEVLVDGLNQATGGSETYPAELRVPAGAKAIEVAGGTSGGREMASLAYAFQIFGRPMRRTDVQCDCERDSTPTIVQTLYLANHPRVRDKIVNPNGRLAEIIKAVADDAKRIEEVFLWTLSRTPSDSERQTCLDYLKESPSTQKGLEDLMWSLLNTREFLLNH